MCDYSLEMYQSRPAVVGEEYVSHRFPSGSNGFISPGDDKTAVCMACDTKLRLENITDFVQRTYGVKESEEVTFCRKEEGPHHDAVRFENGAVLTLQQLGPNVRAVLIDDLAGDMPIKTGKKTEAA